METIDLTDFFNLVSSIDRRVFSVKCLNCGFDCLFNGTPLVGHRYECYYCKVPMQVMGLRLDRIVNNEKYIEISAKLVPNLWELSE